MLICILKNSSYVRPCFGETVTTKSTNTLMRTYIFVFPTLSKCIGIVGRMDFVYYVLLVFPEQGCNIYTEKGWPSDVIIFLN